MKIHDLKILYTKYFRKYGIIQLLLHIQTKKPKNNSYNTHKQKT